LEEGLIIRRASLIIRRAKFRDKKEVDIRLPDQTSGPPVGCMFAVMRIAKFFVFMGMQRGVCPFGE
jgi:hypothetical protein